MRLSLSKFWQQVRGRSWVKMPVIEDVPSSFTARAQDPGVVLLCQSACRPTAIGQVSFVLGKRAECNSLLQLGTLVTVC